MQILHRNNFQSHQLAVTTAINVEKRAQDKMVEETKLLAAGYTRMKNHESKLSHENAVAELDEQTRRFGMECSIRTELSRNEVRIHQAACLEEERKQKAISQKLSIGTNCFIRIGKSCFIQKNFRSKQTFCSH